MQALCYLKINNASNTSNPNKCNADKDYVVPIVSYASEVRYPNKSALILNEKLQKCYKFCPWNPFWLQKMTVNPVRNLPPSIYLNSTVSYPNIISPTKTTMQM